MGYTHYFDHKRDFTDAEWSLIQSLTLHAIDKLPATTASAGGYHSDDPLRIRDGWGKGDPVINSEEIIFNGDESDGMDHEGFMLTKHTDPDEFTFCKTARKPYDLLVTTVLLIANHVAPDALTYSSDGTEDDWEDGVIFFNSIQNKWSIDRPNFTYPGEIL